MIDKLTVTIQKIKDKISGVSSQSQQELSQIDQSQETRTKVGAEWNRSIGNLKYNLSRENTEGFYELLL